MNKIKFSISIIVASVLLATQFSACSKGGGTNPPADPCAGKTITITATPTPSNGCGAPNGSISASASGSTGFQFKLNSGGSYQASGLFNGLAAGSYTIFAKDADGCEKSQAVTVTATGTTFTVSAAATTTSGCGSADGSITVTASGSSGFQYKLNAGGTYGSANVFSNLAEGSYTVFVKDGTGCENSQAVNVSSGGPGPKFSAVRTLLNTRCISCHSGATPAGGRDWTVNCNVVANKNLINNRAVIIGDMPQGGPILSTAEKAIITNWINAGGKLTD